MCDENPPVEQVAMMPVESGLTDEMVERAAIAAFDYGHHKGGPWTWKSIPEMGRNNYRMTVRAALLAAGPWTGKLDREKAIEVVRAVFERDCPYLGREEREQHWAEQIADAVLAMQGGDAR